MTIAILFDAVRGNGGSYQMSINNLLTLVKNFKKKKIKLVVLTNKKELNLDQENCVIHWMEDMNIQNYLHLAFKYDIIEFSTSLKPYITLELLKKHNKVIFFDPDIFIYKSKLHYFRNLTSIN